jgi:mitosis inhibitor protein kinase SWE1
MTPPASTFSPAEPPIFEDVKPLQEAFEQPSTALRKFKPRDSGVSVGNGEDDRLKIPPMSVLRPSAASRPRRPPMLKRTSSMGDERERDRPLETPIEPAQHSGWPGVAAFNFLGAAGLPVMLREKEEEKPEMPGTPVKRNHFNGGGRRGMGHSSSQPSLGSGSRSGGAVEDVMMGEPAPVLVGEGKGKGKVPPPTMRKKSGTMGTMMGMVPHLTLNGAGPGSSSPEAECSSPTVRVAQREGVMMTAEKTRVGLLRTNSGSESDGTPTKGGGEKVALAGELYQAKYGLIADILAGRPDLSLTPSKPPAHAHPVPLHTSSSSGIYPRMSLPAFPNPKIHRTLHHRQSHPATKPQDVQEEEDIFETRFITLETLGKGAFSTVFKVQDRHGDGLYAVKKARGVFDGVRDR